MNWNLKEKNNFEEFLAHSELLRKDKIKYYVLFHYFDKFLLEYENRFEKEYGYFRPVIKEVVERYLDCGNPKCGFARIRCQDCGSEFLLHFSCRIRGFCPSCHAKRLEEWSEWMREGLLLDAPYHQVIFVIPEMMRLFFKYKHRLLGDLCQPAIQALHTIQEKTSRLRCVCLTIWTGISR